MVTALRRLFFTRVLSGVAWQATVTVRAGLAASANCGEKPRSGVGPVIVSTRAAVAMPATMNDFRILSTSL
jgi:hypothetical protein